MGSEESPAAVGDSHSTATTGSGFAHWLTEEGGKGVAHDFMGRVLAELAGSQPRSPESSAMGSRLVTWSARSVDRMERSCGPCRQRLNYFRRVEQSAGKSAVQWGPSARDRARGMARTRGNTGRAVWILNGPNWVPPAQQVIHSFFLLFFSFFFL
jgi:hypothetical protein